MDAFICQFVVALSLVVADDAPPASAPLVSAEGVVLLRNGEVLHGSIEATAEQVVITAKGATVRLHRAETAFIGQDIHEVYRHQRSRRDLRRAVDSLSLAQWCLRHDLLDEAEAELVDARRIEPGLAQIDHLSRKIEVRRGDLARATRTKKPQDPSSERVPSTEELNRLVRGLRRDVVEQFAGAIQPLLLNQCSTAGCHSSRSEGEFRLAEGAGGRPSRRLTLRNLQVVLQHIDRQRPDNSPLLRQATTAHGTLLTPVFADREAATYRRLSQWIRDVSGQEPKRPSTPTFVANPAQQVLGQVQTSASGIVPASAVEEIDPFDPAGFNQQSPR